jgi:hypothetical protein
MEKQKIDNLTDEQTDLLRRNLEVSEKILKQTDYIKKYIKWQKIWGVIKIVIIVIPLIIGVIYLPPLFKNYFNQFISLYK